MLLVRFYAMLCNTERDEAVNAQQAAEYRAADRMTDACPIFACDAVMLVAYLPPTRNNDIILSALRELYKQLSARHALFQLASVPD